MSGNLRLFIIVKKRNFPLDPCCFFSILIFFTQKFHHQQNPSGQNKLEMLDLLSLILLSLLSEQNFVNEFKSFQKLMV